MRGCLQSLGRLVRYFGFIFICPLIGAWLSGQSLDPYLAFPPVTEKIQVPAFSWSVFYLILTFSLVILLPFLRKSIFLKDKGFPEKPAIFQLPGWGWLGLIFMALSWIVAWNRFGAFNAAQEYTFTPLWLSFILVINALTYRRSGRCLLINRTRLIIPLCFVSACLWWSFEFLNRFVHNWYYVGMSGFEPWQYFVYATLPFSTVLPAVLSTVEWLDTFPSFGVDLNRFKPLPLPDNPSITLIYIVVAFCGLVALGIWAEMLYSLVWILPILLIIGLHSFTEKPHLLRDIEVGKWRRIWLLALSGLICGFFWEMWNIKSLVHWQYNIPYVQRFEVFAMPALGYLGYLPFGIFCGFFVDFVLPAFSKKDCVTGAD